MSFSNHSKWLRAAGVFAALSVGAIARADNDSAGVKGINSRNLGLTGAGQSFGQIELGRPGEDTSFFPDFVGEWYWDYGADRVPGSADAGEGDGAYTAGETYVDLDGNNIYSPLWRNGHPDVEPWLTRVNGAATPSRAPKLPTKNPSAYINMNDAFYVANFYENTHHSISPHALQVASVIKSNNPNFEGVALSAKLYSGAFGRKNATADDVIVTTQDIINQLADTNEPNLSNIRTVNHSWGGPALNKTGSGLKQQTLAIDYFAKKYDTLQVTAGDETGSDTPGSPADLFNGINVSMLQIDPSTGIFDRYDNDNRYTPAPNTRVMVQLCAPGENIRLARLGTAGYALSGGTSFAAPHVTGTATLLQEYGDAHRASEPLRWDSSARRHQVMKAVLMNSADKIKDDGLYAPVGYALGMEKTIYKNDTGTQTFLDSFAYFNGSNPVDEHIGAGALNANRALTQYAAGEYDVSSRIPFIGWDHGFTYAGSSADYEYFFNYPLLNEGFVSATLAWDRDVTLTGGDEVFNRGESFDSGGLVNLDLQLLISDGAGGWNIVNESYSSVDSVEHIFFKLTQTGDYMLRVQERGSDSAIEYGLAWWAVPEPTALALMFVAGIGMIARRRRA